MTILTPEQKARVHIDSLLTKAGWQVQTRSQMNRTAASGVAVCEFPLTTGEVDWFGLKKFMGGAVFSVGLMLVVIAGAELFTGNNLMTVALFSRKIGYGGLLRNWMPVYLGNLIGSVFLALLVGLGTTMLAGAVGATALKIGAAKVSAGNDDFWEHNMNVFFRGIGCNMLVCLAVMMAIAAKDIIGKIFAIFFPIMTFVMVGFEHCVANMYFIPAAICAKAQEKAVEASGLGSQALADVNWSSMWTNNLIAVTLGNIVGGVIFVGLIYFYAHVRGSDADATNGAKA